MNKRDEQPWRRRRDDIIETVGIVLGCALAVAAGTAIVAGALMLAERALS